MKSTSTTTLFPQRLGNYDKIESWSHIGKMVPFLFTSLAIVIVFSFFFKYSPNPFIFMPKEGLNSVQNLHAVQENLSKTHIGKI